MKLLGQFFRCSLISGVLLAFLVGCTSRPAGGGSDVEIRRTTDGIPHIKANTWQGLGYGYGYVQAEDALCTLAEAFVTYDGKRSYYWGAEGRPYHNSTFGQSKNLELDIFFKGLVDQELVTQYRHAQSKEVQKLVMGFTAGYNHYLDSLGAEHSAYSCEGKNWLRPITTDDMYRRMYAAGLAAGYARFIPQIVNARPPVNQKSSTQRTSQLLNNRAALAQQFKNKIGDQPDIGSNALAFGEEVTGEKQGVLFGNPHWYWGGPDRFYQAHLTIPGELNVAGVSFLGVPVINIGFNNNVAWSHTVSAARRYGLFELTLSDADPTAYKVDDQTIAMKRKPIEIEVRDETGQIHTVKHTLYESEYGPIVDFGEAAPPLNWQANRALAIRDINANNFHMFDHYLRWGQAASLDEFVAIQKETRAVPWVNTIAIGRNDGRTWYGDIGAVPYVTDELRQRCAGKNAVMFARLDEFAPLLDGSRSDCHWQTDDNLHIGVMPVERMPGLFSKRYVANMNNSYWLSQPDAPIEDIDLIFGGENHAQSLRTQMGHLLANNVAKQDWNHAVELNQVLQKNMLDARSYAAVRFKDELLKEVCGKTQVQVTHDILTGKVFETPQDVNIKPACSTLAQWNNRAEAEDRGSLIWDAWWYRLLRIPASELYRVPFSPSKPLSTPAQPNGQDPNVAEALGAAVLWMHSKGMDLDEARGKVLFAKVEGQEVELFGGCGWGGYFTVSCDKDGYEMTDRSLGNSYLQLVNFNADGVDAYTLLAHGQDERALNGDPGGEPVKRYANKQWLRMPFIDDEINKDPKLKRYKLKITE
jgi:acyl-homoserine-lactone acylase